MSSSSLIDAVQCASLDGVRELLAADARSWAAQLGELQALAVRAEAAGAQVRRTLSLELAGSWQVGQLTAERWLAEACRVVEALPRTLAMLGSGTLLRHQAVVLLHRTQGCDPELAQAVEAEVLPEGASLCPSDLQRQVDRVRLRLEAERDLDARAERVAERRTWLRPVEDGMAVAGALLTAEQGIAWASGMDALERRERQADRAAGVDRTAEQRRADLFAALPAMVLAGWAQDDRWRQRPGCPADGDRSPSRAATEPLFDTTAGPTAVDVHDRPGVRAGRPERPRPGRDRAGPLAGSRVSLDGYGPVGAAHVRLLRPHSVRRVMVDSRSGRPIAVDDRPTPVDPRPAGPRCRDMLRPDLVVDADEPQHDPGARLARLVDLRDARCAGPGCASRRCDRDHLHPGPTERPAPPTSAC